MKVAEAAQEPLGFEHRGVIQPPLALAFVASAS